MGKDKFENEDLIKYGWEEDIWFHTDRHSSAHIYLRMQPGMQWDQLPETLLVDLAQLTKANSITGNKQDNVVVLYTPWSNLKKTPGMEVGAVTFHSAKKVKKISVKTRQNEIINRLNKTKIEKYPDLDQEKIDHLRKLKTAEREMNAAARKEEEEAIQRKRIEKQNWDYANVIKEEDMYSNKGMTGIKSVQEAEDDFM